MAVAVGQEIAVLAGKVRRYYPQADLSLIERAFLFARDAHGTQTRVSGELYIEHPYAAACILADMQLDVATICAALLHDVPEDTKTTLDEVEAAFGPEIAKLVDGVTKLSRISWETLEEKQAENLRKMFLAMAEDPRVVLIKLADRLHNMRTLDSLPPRKQATIAQETLEIFAPLAHRLGIWEFKWELEDLAYRYLEPEKYKEITRLLAGRRVEREAYIEGAVAALKIELERLHIKADVTGRPKHVYSIAKKLEKQGTFDFTQLFDLLAVRILVDEVKDCYAAIGVIHSLWKPIPGRFKDYIAMPKANGYQSLHTTVFCFDGQPLEVQVRTYEMHRVAEIGVAAHWRYKEGGPTGDPDFDAKLAWLRQIMDWQRDVSAREFVESVKIDLFQDEVFVFTPKGAVKTLPARSTPVDFAYRIHTDIGNRCIGAKVNGRVVSLDYQLKHGDIVEILTTKAPKGPSRDWLDIVRTAGAREKIRQWFKREERDENISHGKELLDKELRRMSGQSLSVVHDRLAGVAEAMHYKTVDDLFAAIGYGASTSAQVITKLGFRDDHERIAVIPTEAGSTTERTASTSSVTVKGVGDLLTRLANCCKPVPGDDIVGFITRGRGITVHRADCFSIRNEDERERLVKVEWVKAKKASYPVTIRIEAWDREGLLRDMSTVIAEEGLSFVAASANVHSDQTATLTATINITGLEQLSRLFNRMERIKDVMSVERDTTSMAAP
jgi:GTP pyrophosphokinase